MQNSGDFTFLFQPIFSSYKEASQIEYESILSVLQTHIETVNLNRWHVSDNSTQKIKSAEKKLCLIWTLCFCQREN